MRQRLLTVLVLALAALVLALLGRADHAAASDASSVDAQPADGEPSRLAIVWTSGDPDVAHRMTLMYAGAAKRAGWFDEVHLIVWGPSQRLLGADKDIRASITQMQENGVVVEACQACADSYGLTGTLRDFGFTVKYMGRPLSDFLKADDCSVITF